MNALALGLSGLMVVGSAAADTRIAFSKAANIEVLAAGDATDWCRPLPGLILKVGVGADASQEVVSDFVAKVGRMLEKNCPQATGASIQVWQNNVQVASAFTSQPNGWQLSQWTGSGVAASAPVQPSISTLSQSPSPTSSPSQNSNADAVLAELLAMQSDKTSSTPPVKPESAEVTTSGSVSDTGSMPSEVINPAESVAPTVTTVVTPTSFEVSKTVYEGLIKTSDKACTLRYNIVTSQAVADQMSVQPQGVSCDSNGYLHGQGSVQVFDAKGQREASLIGSFSHGYFTNTALIQEPFLGRGTQMYTPGAIHKDWLAYQANTAKTVGGEKYFPILMVKGPRWSQCLVPAIRIVGNESSFLSESYLNQVIDKARNLVLESCPGAKKIHYEITTSLMVEDVGEESLVFTGDGQLSGSGWHLANGKNLVVAREEKRQEEIHKQQEAERQRLLVEEQQKQRNWNNAFSDYQQLQKVSRMARVEKLSPIQKSLTDMQMAVSLSAKTNVTIKEVFTMARIDSVDGKDGSIDWPYPVKIHRDPDFETGVIQKDEMGEIVSAFPQDDGWYLLAGNIETSKKRGDDEPETRFNLTSAFSCKQDECAEFDDVTGLIRANYNLPDWQPMSYEDYKQGDN